MSSTESIRATVRRLRRSLNWLGHICFVDSEPDPARSVFICGARRSGTTWLAEVLNYANEYRLLCEPFDRGEVPQCRHFFKRQYLRPDNNDPKYVESARAIFSGRIRNPWVDQYNRRIIAQRRLIKDTRSTLMLKWVREHFPEMPIIFLVRHPCAVALSRTKLQWRTDLRETVFFQQDSLVADYLAPFADKITWANTAFERHVVDWCIENLVPFSQLKKGDVYLAFYENLVANPTKELPRIFSFLKRPFDDAVLDGLHKPSATSRKKGDVSAILSGDSLIDGWRKYVSADELAASRRITELFGLDQIYGDGSSANVPMAEGLITELPTAHDGSVRKTKC